MLPNGLSFEAPITIPCGEQLVVMVALAKDPMILMIRALLPPSAEDQMLTAFDFNACYLTMPKNAGSFKSIDDVVTAVASQKKSARFYQIQPWRDVEEIAAHVQGDGSDPMRCALADSIREHQRGFSWPKEEK